MGKVTVTAESGGLRVLTLNDPDRRNVIDGEMRSALLEGVEDVRSDGEARALVIAGAGSAFCGGADLPATFGDVSRPVAAIRDDLRQVYESFLVLRTLAIPTIAAVHGPAVGAGLNLAMACDMRVIGPQAFFAATFSQIGLHPGGGCTWFLVEAMGAERALGLLLDGGRVQGRDAVDAGLAMSLDDEPLAKAMEMGRRYADMDPQLARDVKRAVQIAAQGGFDATLQFESWAQASSATKPAIQEHAARFRH